jgi:glycosyltransferase involved in cell wall biosynthesis
VRVAIDARQAAAPRPSGVGEYTLQLVRRMPPARPDWSFAAWYLDARRPHRRHRLGAVSPNVREVSVPIPSRLFGPTAARFDAPRIEWFGAFDVLFAPNFLPPPTRAGRIVLTVHDLAFRLFPESAPASTRAWLEALPRALDQAARVLVPSECTKADLLREYDVDPARVRVTPLGVDRDRYRPASPKRVAEARARFGIEGPYLLFVGAIEPRKNLPLLVRAFARVAPGPARAKLVIAGSGVPWNPEGDEQLERALGEVPASVAERVLRTGYVGPDDKVALLTGADALVFPSAYEGFGLPVLEAMACGTAVLTSRSSALPEVAGEAALRVDSADAGAVATGMEDLLSDDALRAALRAKGLERAAAFDWDTTAELTAVAVEEAARGA